MARRRRQAFHVYDLETVNWVDPLSACGITEDGQILYFTGPDSHRLLAEAMCRIGGVWCAHVGGRFDALLLLKHLPPIIDMCIVGSTILSAHLLGGLVLRDTYPGWLSPLKDVGTSVGLPKLEYDAGKLATLTPSELRDYNLRDCEILAKAIERHTYYSDALGMTRKWTAGASAVEALKVLEPGAYASMVEHRIHHEKIIAARPCARGGRVEAPYRGEVHGVYCYDIKSSYPARYFQGAMGVGLQHLNKHQAKRAWDNTHAILRVCWRTNRMHGYAPAIDDITYSGSGICQAWLTWEERQAVGEVATEVEAVEGWASTYNIPFGQVFTNTLFPLKQKGVFFSKVWVNSLHGKLLEHPLKESWTQKQPPEDDWYEDEAPEYLDAVELYRYTTLSADYHGFCDPHYQPISAALVYGRARADITRIIRLVEQAGGLFYYTDTDSIHCSLSPDKMPVELGKELGCLNSEGGPYDALYAGPKMYYLVHRETGERKTACKGVRLSDLKSAKVTDGVYAWHPQGEDVQEQFFRDILKGGAKYHKTGVKSFKSGTSGADWTVAVDMQRFIQPTGSGRAYPSQGFAPYIHYG